MPAFWELALRPLYTRARRLLAIGANTRTGMKLEASGAQYCGVGRGHPFNDAHAGHWRYAVGDGHGRDLFVFLPWLCEVDGWGDRPLCEARFNRAKTYTRRRTLTAARRAHTSRRRASPRRTKQHNPRRLSTTRRAGAPTSRPASRPRDLGGGAVSNRARSHVEAEGFATWAAVHAPN